MDGSLQITLRDLAPSAELERQIRERTLKLERLCPDINSCKVVLETRQRERSQGQMFRAHVHLHLPSRQIVVAEDDRDMFQALHHAFDDAKRRLGELANTDGEPATFNSEHSNSRMD